MNFKHKLSKRLAIIWAAVALFACVGEQPTTPANTDLSIPPGISTPVSTATPILLFAEPFEDGAFASRGWYDNTSMVTTTAEHVPGSTRALELRFAAGATTPVAGGSARRQFAATPTVYVSYWVKYSTNWIGSGQAYHPHEFLIVSDQDGEWDGPAQSWLVAYVEHNYQNGGIPRLQLQDNKAINTSFGVPPVNLVNTTENRSTSGCNGVVEANVVTTCFSMPPWYNDKEVQAPAVTFKPTEGPGYKANWNHVEAYFQLNSIADGKGVADGVMQYWFNGALIIDRHDILFRTAARPNIQFDKFMIAPYIGDGSPVAQTMWVDNLTVATGRIATDSSNPPPSPPPPPPPPSSSAPGTVSDLAVAAVADSGVTLSFTEVNDGNGQPAKYDVRFAKGTIAWGAGTDVSSGTCKVPVAGTTIDATRTCTVRGLTPSTAYQLQLVPFRGTLNVDAVFGGLSNVVSATTTATAPPPPVQPTIPGTIADLAVTAVTDSSATLSFTEVNDGTGVPAKYFVRFKSPTITTWTSATDVTKGGCKVPLSGTTIGAKRTCKVQGLTASTAYQFQMVAFRGTLNVDAIFGALSNLTSGTTNPKAVVLTKPATVTDLAVSGSDDSTITLAFTEVNDGSGQPASYFVRFGPAPFSWGAGSDVSRGSCKVPVTGTAIGARRTCAIAGLMPGTNYQAQVVAFRGALNADAEFGDLSPVASGTTTSVAPPPQPPPPPVPPPPPPPSGGAWPNEPAGFTLLSDYGFGDFVPATNRGDLLGAGWRIWWNDRGLGTLAQDNTAPQSPGGVFQVHYPVGWLSGYEPTMTEYVFSPHVTELYWGFWWKPSNPFQSDASGVNKIAFVWTPSGATDLIYFDLSPGPWRIRAMDDLIAGGGPRAGLRDEPNMATTVITLGQWHRIEIYLKYSTGTQANGVLKWWVDGTLNGHYTNLKMVQDGGFDHLQFAPTYGGNTGDRKQEDDYYWYDHVRVSRGP